MVDTHVRDLTIAMGKQLSLTAEEDIGLDLDDGNGIDLEGDISKWCLVDTVLTRKRYNMEALESTLAGVWRPVKGMHMKSLGNNLFALYFFHPVDMKRIMAAGPWRFADHVMVLKEVQEGKPVAKEDLVEVPFWIQIYGLPPGRMTKATGERIGAELGRLLEVDAGDGRVWGMEFIRVRVCINSRKPLRRGMKLSLKDGPLWISFKYERLPHFCYWCGMLDHVEQDCELGLEMESTSLIEHPYDDSLRAMPKRGKQGAAANTGRWLRDASGNPVREEPRWRSQNPKMESHSNLETRDPHGDMIDFNGHD
ncbi:hypothetical protein SLE2022_249390 [Rubroshorea leprosula]